MVGIVAFFFIFLIDFHCPTIENQPFLPNVLDPAASEENYREPGTALESNRGQEENITTDSNFVKSLQSPNSSFSSLESPQSRYSELQSSSCACFNVCALLCSAVADALCTHTLCGCLTALSLQPRAASRESSAGSQPAQGPCQGRKGGKDIFWRVNFEGELIN